MNNTYNGVYFAVTLQHQLDLIRGNNAQGALSSSIVYGNMTLCFLGSLLGIGQLLALCWTSRGFPVPDRCLRLGLNIKYAQIWMKIVLLRYLQHNAQADWNTRILFVNTVITLGLTAWSGWNSGKNRNSEKMATDMWGPRLFRISYMVLHASSKGIVALLLLFSYLTSTFVLDIPDWLMAAIPAWYVLGFGPLVVEGARYIEGCSSPTPLQACEEIQSVRLVALWAAWQFPMQVTCLLFVNGPTTSISLFLGLIGNTANGHWFEHSLMTLFSLCAWGASMCMAIGAREALE